MSDFNINDCCLKNTDNTITFFLPADEYFPEEIHDLTIIVDGYDYCGAEPEVGINHGYFETIEISTPEHDKLDLFNEYKDDILETYGEELDEMFHESYDEDYARREWENEDYSLR